MEDKLVVPQTVAIILDGNRTSAKRKKMDPCMGHEWGFERVKVIWPYAKSIDVRFLILWAFSTDNWNRPYLEVAALMSLLLRALKQVHAEMHEKKVRVAFIGRRDRLKPDIVALMEEIERETRQYADFCIVVALDYGGKDELERASAQLLAAKDPTKSVYDFLDTVREGIPDPDFIIRTGGQERMSGFLPAQEARASSESYFTSVCWPDFGIAEFQEAINEFGRRERKRGT